MKRTALYLAITSTLFVESFRVSADAALATSRSALKLFSNKVTIALPKTAGTLKKINSKTYQVQPTSSERKFVIYVTREALRKDELRKTNKQLASSIKMLLEAQGYEVIRLKNAGDTFSADFRTYSNVPWQKVGTSPARGTAKFTRTRSQELIGTILLCDPRQWSDSETKQFKRVVATTKVLK